ncbi:MAG: hypothetical protein IPM39_27040 [Chloroflexi bacterium]|nr:hypothetical protein [Chloroflexota bacterium]
MNLEFCPNDDCPARGQVGKGNIRSHSQKEKRCYCTECNRTFVITKGTPFYRLRTDPQIVIWTPGHMKQVIFGALDFARIRKRLSKPF